MIEDDDNEKCLLLWKIKQNLKTGGQEQDGQAESQGGHNGVDSQVGNLGENHVR